MSTLLPPTEPRDLATWLRHAREARGLSLRDLAAATHLDSTVLNRVETRTRHATDDQIAHLATYFAADPDHLKALQFAAKIRALYSDDPAAGRAALSIVAEDERLTGAQPKGGR